MNKYFLITLALVSNLFSFAQIPQDQIVHRPGLLYKSVQIGANYYKAPKKIVPGDFGTGFFVKKKNHYYLVTAYHILTERSSQDTSILFYPITPNLIAVRFHSKKGDSTVVGVFFLFNRLGRRKFYSVPYKNGKSVLDVAILPIDSIPSGAIIDPIDLASIDTTFAINSFSELYVCGYREEVEFRAILPTIDTVKSLPPNVFNYNDSLILATSFKNITLHGSSGGPVYTDINGRPQIVGICSREMPAKEHTLPTFIFISISELRRHFHFY